MLFSMLIMPYWALVLIILSIMWALPSLIKLDIASLLIIISQAGMDPSFVEGINLCEIITSTTCESCDFISFCLSSSKEAIILSTVWEAELVCKVVKTKCPVSAIWSVDLIVSKSLISPINTIFGSCLITERSAVSHEWESKNISLCSIKDNLLVKTYSIGSSIVIMCSDLVLLIFSIIDAIVVDFPCPAGPTIITRPCFRLQTVLSIGGRCNSSIVGIFIEICLKATEG